MLFFQTETGYDFFQFNLMPSALVSVSDVRASKKSKDQMSSGFPPSGLESSAFGVARG
jgi:hypothetical protein